VCPDLVGAWLFSSCFVGRTCCGLPVGLSLDAVLLVALSLDVINPCYPRCVGTVVELCCYWPDDGQIEGRNMSLE
jgi:hypothetical protein